MAALQRLLELLRIAEQHQALARRGDREHVRQRHLPGLVDNQHVDALLEVFPHPTPGRRADDVDAAVLDAAANDAVVTLVLDAPLACGRALALLVHCAESRSLR